MGAFKAEVAEAEVEVVVANGDPDMFIFSRSAAPDVPWPISPGSYTVTVAFCNAASAIYLGGHGHDWVMEFRDDLRTGRFGHLEHWYAATADAGQTAGGDSYP